MGDWLRICIPLIYEHIFLNLFRTQLFREFKLCKLLLRPLDDHSSARCSSSRQLRGYSRQTESYISSLSNTVDNSANDADFDDYNLPWGDLRRSALYRYQRPGSRAYSLPTKVGLGTLRPFTYYWGGRCCPLPAPRESQLRGYSRQTESLQPANQGRTGYVTAFSLLLRRSALYRYQRPGSRAYSLPTKVGLGTLHPFTYYWGDRRCIATSAPGVAPTACPPRSD